MKIELTQIERMAAVEMLRMVGNGYAGNPSDFIDDHAKMWKHRFYISCAEMLAGIDWKTDLIGKKKIKLTQGQLIDLYFATQSNSAKHPSEQIRSFCRQLIYSTFTCILNWRENGL